MSTTTKAPRVVIRIPPNIIGDAEAMQELRDGLVNAETRVQKPEIEPLWDPKESAYDESLNSWERLVDEAAAEIAESVAQMMEDAIAKRLPWESEPISGQ
jgi:hypothetical protein